MPITKSEFINVLPTERREKIITLKDTGKNQIQALLAAVEHLGVVDSYLSTLLIKSKI